MNRMGHPFDWSARKRRGSGQNAADAYDQYFHDDVDFPHFGSTWDAFNRAGNKRSQHPTADVNDRSGFFDYLPPEFRQYIPDNFGFGNAGIRHGQHAQQPFHAQATHQPQPPPPQQSHHQQFYEPSATSTSANSSRSNLCDAAIQTEDPSTAAGNERGSHQSEVPLTAPHHNSSSASASSSSVSSPYGNQMHTSTSADGPNAFANASAANPQSHQYSQSPQQQYYQQNPGRQQPYAQSPQGQFYQRQPTAAPTTAAAGPPHPTHPPATGNPSQGENFVRNVPIFIEGSAAPVTKPTKPRPDPIVCKEAPIQHDQQQQQAPVSHPSNQTQETSAGANNGSAAEAVPPQTPHTADCITKIQAIQRDVLDLMCAVEQFGGKRGDKEYGYLDEMLTRNLLKLDTIDTNGKDSIRMARKEAIKCIQASIAVLEAKADLNLNENQENATAAAGAVTTGETPSGARDEAIELSHTEVIALPPAPEKMDTNELVAAKSEQPEESKQVSDAIAAEIPKVQENVENIRIDDEAPAAAAAAAAPNPDAGATGNDQASTKADEDASTE